MMVVMVEMPPVEMVVMMVVEEPPVEEMVVMVMMVILRHLDLRGVGVALPEHLVGHLELVDRIRDRRKKLGERRRLHGSGAGRHGVCRSGRNESGRGGRESEKLFVPVRLRFSPGRSIRSLRTAERVFRSNARGLTTMRPIDQKLR
jgi:hypothetical protein